MPIRFPSDPSLVTLGVLAVVASGNALWGAHAEWRTLRSVVLFGTCVLILVARARVGRVLSDLVATADAESQIPLTARSSAMSLMTMGILGVALFVVVLAGELVPAESGALSHVRLFLLAPACVLLLYDWHRARQLVLLSSAARGADLVSTQGLFALESLLFRGTWIAVCAVAALAIGNALWGQLQPWVTLRPVLYGAVFFAIVWKLHGGINGALAKLANAVVDEGLRAHSLSREWAVENDAMRERSWSTQAILAALDLETGMRVADVGAGGGYLAIKIAERVGPAGSVFATDISPALVTRLREQAQRRGLTQLCAQHVDPKWPLPAPEPLDRILVANVYLFRLDDEDASRQRLEHLIGPLLSGGKLVIYNEFVHEKGWVASPEWPPLAASEADADQLIQWAADRCELIGEIALPPPPANRPLAPHEKPGYLIVLQRR